MSLPAARRKPSLSGWLTAGVVGLLTLSVVGSALSASPFLAGWSLMPVWAGRWLDAHPDSRHLVGYAGLAFAVGWLVGAGRCGRTWLVAALALATLAGVLELAQMLLPRRSADWHDFAWSCAGVVIGLVASRMLIVFSRRSGTRS